MKRPQEEIDLIKMKYPSLPDHAIPKTRKRKKTPTAELTHQILTHIKLIGGQAYRLNSQGQFDPRTKQWRPSGQKRGLADIQIIYKGRFIACEVKASKTDKLSEYQLARKVEIEKAGGLFIEARKYDQFKHDLEQIIKTI